MDNGKFGRASVGVHEALYHKEPVDRSSTDCRAVKSHCMQASAQPMLTSPLPFRRGLCSGYFHGAPGNFIQFLLRLHGSSLIIPQVFQPAGVEAKRARLELTLLLEKRPPTGHADAPRYRSY